MGFLPAPRTTQYTIIHTGHFGTCDAKTLEERGGHLHHPEQGFEGGAKAFDGSLQTPRALRIEVGLLAACSEKTKKHDLEEPSVCCKVEASAWG